jgi:hypothetical protein
LGEVLTASPTKTVGLSELNLEVGLASALALRFFEPLISTLFGSIVQFEQQFVHYSYIACFTYYSNN